MTARPSRLTNIVLQAQIVERLVDRDPAQARGELRLLVADGPADAGRHQELHLRRPARWSSTTWASCPRSGARPASAGGARTSRWSSSPWARTGGSRMDVESARLPRSSTRRWPRTWRWPRSGCAPPGLGRRAGGPPVATARVAGRRRTRAAARGADRDMPDAIRQMIEDRHDARHAAVVAAEAGGHRGPAGGGPARRPGARRVHRRDGGDPRRRQRAPARRPAAARPSRDPAEDGEPPTGEPPRRSEDPGPATWRRPSSWAVRRCSRW